MQFEKINDGLDDLVIFDLGDGDFGIHYVGPVAFSQNLEIWHNHDHNGSGCNNLVIDAFGRELDLEFCRSRALTEAESEAIAAIPA